jgi:hypothetical protein
MSHRTFRDAEGVLWQVWEVRPSWAERRAAERRSERRHDPEPHADRRSARDRRRAEEARPRVTQGIEAGWLAFLCNGERRRLAPPPCGWQELTDDALGELCAQASGSRRRRKPSA